MKPVLMVSGLLSVGAFVRDAAAQATPPSITPPPTTAAPPGDNSGILMALALMGALLLLVGIGVKLWDYRRKREAEAIHLQSQVSDALLREADFFGLAITPTVTAGMRRGAPMKVVITGQAPSSTIRDAALRIVRDEAARLGVDVDIEDRVEVTTEAARRVA
jgi:hypothetical protein